MSMVVAFVASSIVLIASALIVWNMFTEGRKGRRWSGYLRPAVAVFRPNKNALR